MHQATYDIFRKLIHDHGGIALGDDQQALLSGRIRRRMGTLGVSTPETYLRHVRADDSGTEIIQLLDAIATNHTFFFRESQHFDPLTEWVLGRVRSGNRRIRVWSAACSTGEEPYGVAIVLLSALARHGYHEVDLKVLATDISTKALETAVAGQYSSSRVSCVPESYRPYFERVSGAKDVFRVVDRVRELVTFRRLNLTEGRFPMRGPFDAVLCRNVMIYFDEPTRRRLLNDLAAILAPGAPLFVGMTESALGTCDELEYSQPSVYRRRARGPVGETRQ